MSDLIDRQMAIDTEGLDEQIRCEMCRNPIHTDRGCDGNCKYDEKLYERIMQILSERITPLSSAQPERKRGKWIITKTERAWNCGEYPIEVTCSNCGYSKDYYMKDNFCPCCGADMRGESDK